MGGEQADDPVRIPHGGDLRHAYHDGLGGARHRVLKALLDARRAIHQHVIILGGQILGDLLHLFRGNRGFFPGLSGRQEEQAHVALVFDEGLLEAADPLGHVHQVVDDAVFQAHDHIQVPQADIGIDEHYGFAPHGQAGADVRGGRGFAHAALTGRNDDNFSHTVTPPYL